MRINHGDLSPCSPLNVFVRVLTLCDELRIGDPSVVGSRTGANKSSDTLFADIMRWFGDGSGRRPPFHYWLTWPDHTKSFIATLES